MSAHERTIETVEAPVVEHRDLGAGYRLMRLRAPEVAVRARAGQFLTLGLLGVTDPLLPRPFAVFDVDRAAGEVEVLYKIVGRGTRLFAEMHEEERLRLTGPLGRGWRKPEEGAAILVAGGTAWAGLHLLAKELAEDEQDVRAIWGQPCEASFPNAGPQGVELRLATDDGSCGFPGTSVDCARHLVEDELEDEFDARPSLYGAGPLPMLRELATFAGDWRIPLQVSLEARMACGIGVCRGCVVNARAPHPETGLRRRAVCTDGPVFDAAELDWENLL